MAEIHDGNLCLYFVEGAVIFQFYDSAGIVLPCFLFFVVGEEHFAHGSFAQLFLEGELSRRVLLYEVDVFDHLLKIPGGEEFCLNVTLEEIGGVLSLILFGGVDLIGPFLG